MKREGGIVTNLKDIQQVKALIAKGKAAGYLTVEEVSKSVPAEMSSPENFEEIIALFDQLDIAIVDSEKEGKSIAVNHADAENEPMDPWVSIFSLWIKEPPVPGLFCSTERKISWASPRKNLRNFIPIKAGWSMTRRKSSPPNTR